LKVTPGSAYHPIQSGEGEAMGKEEGWAENEEAADEVEVANRLTLQHRLYQTNKGISWYLQLINAWFNATFTNWPYEWNNLYKTLDSNPLMKCLGFKDNILFFECIIVRKG
jgi:hypothetical protein